jgi:hypothetical protein
MVLFDNCTLRRLYRALLSLPHVQVAEVQEGRTERSLVLMTGQSPSRNVKKCPTCHRH